MLIRNIRLFGQSHVEDGAIKDISITKDGKIDIVDSATTNSMFLQNYNADSEYALLPGWLDTHVHGYGGVDFADATFENLSTVTQALGETGLSYCMATLVSLKEEKLFSALQAIDRYVAAHQKPQAGHTQIVGVHLEGPYISQQCKGAHDSSALKNSINMTDFLSIINAAPHITNWKITLDPSLPGALDFISKATQTLNNDHFSVQIFIGHCNPSEEIITEAIQRGAVGFTHLGNACSECCARQLSIENVTSHLTNWVLKNPAICPNGVELIVDGQHLLEPYVKLIYQMIANKIVLITDALGNSGKANGLYYLGDLPIIKEGEAFYLADPKNTSQFLLDEKKNKKLAGSAAALSTITKQFVKWIDGTIEEIFTALYYATIINPRQSGLRHGMQLSDTNNFVIIDKKGALVLSVCHGELKQHKPLKQSSAIYRTFIRNSDAPQENTGQISRRLSF